MFYTDYRYYLILVLLLLILLFCYLIILQGENSGWIPSLFKARWIPESIYIIFIYIIIFVVFSFILYYNYTSSNSEIIYSLVAVLVFTTVLQIFSLYAFRHITFNLIISLCNAIIAGILLYECVKADLTIYAAFAFVFYICILLISYNLYSRNILKKLPFNEASTPELLHYYKLYEKYGIQCMPYETYKPYCHLYSNEKNHIFY